MNDARRILDERLAKGEISEDDHQRLSERIFAAPLHRGGDIKSEEFPNDSTFYRVPWAGNDIEMARVFKAGSYGVKYTGGIANEFLSENERLAWLGSPAFKIMSAICNVIVEFFVGFAILAFFFKVTPVAALAVLVVATLSPAYQLWRFFRDRSSASDMVGNRLLEAGLADAARSEALSMGGDDVKYYSCPQCKSRIGLSDSVCNKCSATTGLHTEEFATIGRARGEYFSTGAHVLSLIVVLFALSTSPGSSTLSPYIAGELRYAMENSKLDERDDVFSTAFKITCAIESESCAKLFATSMSWTFSNHALFKVAKSDVNGSSAQCVGAFNKWFC